MAQSVDNPRPAEVRVLVVDDHAMARDVVSEVVEATAGFIAVGAAASAEEALRRLAQRPADLLLMDVRMPGTDGVAAARAAARLPRHPDVILMSSDECPEIAADPGAHGARAFIRKELINSKLLRHTWAQIAR